MDDSVRKALARQHGLDPETATEEEVNAAVLAAAEDPETPENDEPETPDSPETPETPETPAEPAATGASPLEAKVELLERTNARLVADLDARQRDTAAAETKRRTNLVATAVENAVIKPHEVDLWKGRVTDETQGEAYATVLSDLIRATGATIPTVERGGIDDEPALTGTSTAVGDDGLLPENVSLLTPAERAALKARRGL